VFKP